MTDPLPTKQTLLEEFLSCVLRDPGVRTQVIAALAESTAERRQQLSALLRHPVFSRTTMEMSDLLDIMEDNDFVLELLSYFKSAESKAMEHNGGIPQCPVKVIVPGKVIQCLRNLPECEHCFRFGTQWFCSHPFKRMIALHHAAKGSAS